MASGKYMTVLQNEKSMNDAIFSLLANLHNAARKKNDHIWSPYKFDSLKNIWGDDDETKTNKIENETINCEGHAKESFTVQGNDLNIPEDVIQETSCENDIEELSFQVECKVSKEKNCENIVENCHNKDNSLHGYDFKTQPQSHNLKIPYDSSSDLKYFESIAELFNDGQNQLEVNNNFRHHVQYGAPDKLGFSKQNILTKETYVVGSTSGKELADSGTKHEENGSVLHLPEKVLTMTETFYPSKNGASSDGDNKETMNNLSSKTRRNKKISKQFKAALVEQNALGSKRNMEDSDSSTGSIKPLQKRSAGKTEDVKENCIDKENNFIKALLSVKIIKDDQFYEITINASEFDRIRKKYPQLREVLPDIDTFEKEVPYCVEAVKVIIGYLFHPPYDFNAMPDGRISIEILAATEAWLIQRFHDNFQQHFMKRITASNCQTIYSLARYFDLHQICNACKVFIPNEESFSERRSYKSRKCFIAVSQYVEPLEFCIPLGAAEQLLNDNFDRDIRNTVVFEAITRDFNIAGFQISLDASDGTLNETSAALDIFYSVKLTNSSTDPEEIKLSRPLRPNIVVYFKRKVVVKKQEKMQISVETTIKPYLCFETYENLIKTSNDAEFSLTVESTYRVKNSGGKRFIIGKILYNTRDEV